MTELYDRQVRLPEVGEAGQQRISAAKVRVSGNDGAILEAEYLCRAGVEVLTLTPSHEPKPFRHETAFRFPASRRVGAGAWRALDELRSLLGMSTP
jgi:hypothetical protein